MRKGTILRVVNDLKITPNQLKNLKTLLGDFKIETFDRQRNLAKVYEKRAKSLHDAFCLILQAYPPSSTTSSVDDLKKLALLSLEQFKSHKQSSETKSVDALQKQLTIFTSQVVGLLVNHWDWAKGQDATDEATSCLNTAEKYLVMKNNAEDIATLTPITINSKKQYILQWDQRLSPEYKELNNELKDIKEEASPSTPDWFRKLSAAEQAYICNIKGELKSPSSLKKEFNTFSITWNKINKDSQQLVDDIKIIKNGGPIYPKWYKGLNISQKKMIFALSLSNESLKSINSKLRSFDESLNHHLKNHPNINNEYRLISSLPQWYWLLSNVEQAFMRHFLKNTSSVKEAISFIPSRLRTIPAPANFRSHQLIILDENAEVKQEFPKRLSSSHISSRDVIKKGLPTPIINRHTKSNLNAILQHKSPGQPMLLQTLISPSRVISYLRKFIKNLPPDYNLAQSLEGNLKKTKDKNIFYINHPMNIAKRAFYTASDDPYCNRFMQAAQNIISKTSAYRPLISNYNETLNSGPGTSTFRDWNGRELFLSSYEHLMTLGMKGLSYGSCVSGKDRKSIELTHTDAMLLYKIQYGSWPKFSDTGIDRKNFISIVVELYTSYHAHVLAGQNAPGAEGIKKPNKYSTYWPDDISSAIKKKIGENSLRIDDRIASNNEIHHIKHPSINIKSYQNSRLSNETSRSLTAMSIGEDTCQKLIDTLGLLVSEKPRFYTHQTTLSHLNLFSSARHESKGITDIRDLIKKHHHAKKTKNLQNLCSAVDITTKIFNICQSRPVPPGNRSQTTIDVYSIIRDLSDSNPIHALAKASEAINKLDSMKQKSYQLNKEENLSRSESPTRDFQL